MNIVLNHEPTRAVLYLPCGKREHIESTSVAEASELIAEKVEQLECVAGHVEIFRDGWIVAL